ncbi:MAG: globin family protein [Bacteroidota bacterium]
MQATTISLVQESWAKVVPIADQAMVIFYDKLMERNPSLQAIFPADEEKMASQRNKLRDMLVVAVRGLNDLNTLVPALQALGRRHVDYGVEPKHYEDVGAALLATLEVGLGDAFTPEVKTAWTDVYGIMAKTMIDAAEA